MTTTTKNVVSGKMISVISILMVMSLALNFIQFYNKKPVLSRKKTIVQLNETLKRDINAAKIEINRYKGISEKLDKVVKSANLKLDEYEKKIRKLNFDKKVTDQENIQLKSELEELRTNYMNSIDSLLVAQNLNSTLQMTLENLENRIEVLNEKVGLASLFAIDNLAASALYEKSHGQVHKQTALARRAKLVKVCFDMMENKVISEGDYDLYVRILAPDGELLKNPDEPSSTFENPENNKSITYSNSQTITYNNQKINYCLRWHLPDHLKSGVYIIELYTDKQKLGTTTITLR
jgi:hypothetical protein